MAIPKATLAIATRWMIDEKLPLSVVLILLEMK